MVPKRDVMSKDDAGRNESSWDVERATVGKATNEGMNVRREAEASGTTGQHHRAIVSQRSMETQSTRRTLTYARATWHRMLLDYRGPLVSACR